MRTSRAVSRMLEAGWISRSVDPDDGRGYLVALQPEGRALYQRIVPMVLARQEFLFEGLDEAEREALDRAMTQVLQRARQLARQG